MVAPMTPPSQSPGKSTRRARRRSEIVVPNQPRWYQRFLAWLIYAAIRTVSATLRYRWRELPEPHPQGPAIYCTWHNRLVLCLIGYEYTTTLKPAKGLAALVSASKDGAFLSGILECFSVEPVRGSSSRRGPQALLELTTWAEKGYDLAITPDGPRGPRYVVQEGIMYLAQVTGLPIVPFAYNAKWKLQLKSWDRFQIPLPFSRCEMVLGKASRVPREASDAERELLRQALEQELKNITRD